ncbi:MAG TPA: ROK family protein [Frankiaceae bacterium]|jgi:glucokinase|nr:ROK family protein [Frankiaceae bacterium]
MTRPQAGARDPVLAIDIGGTKMAGALVDATGRVHGRRQVATAPDPAAALAQLVDEVLAGSAGVALAGVGAGCGGPMSWPAGVVNPLNIPDWRAGFPLREWLGNRVPGIPVRVHNDALCVVAGETWCGAATGLRDVLGMVVSTGVGGGLVLDGRLRDGASGNAGHIGHIIAEPGGPVCGCGARGCLEAVARGPMVVAWAAERGCTARDGRELAQLARDGDEVALAAFDRAGSAVGRVVAGVVALLELDAVVIGGGLTSAGDLLFGPLQREYAAHAQLHYTRGVPVRATGLGQDAGLIGAAALVLQADRFWSGD